MTSVVINAENKEYFQNLISEPMQDRMNEADVFALGAVDENGMACAVLLCRIGEDDRAELLWLYTAKESRRQGAALLLLQVLCGVLKERGYTEIYCLMADDEENDDLMMFFMTLGFDFSSVAADLTTVTVGALSQWLEKNNVGVGKCCAIKDIPKGYIYSYIKEAYEKDPNAFPLLDVENGLQDFYPGSCGIIEGGKLVGLTLAVLREDEEGVAVVFLNTSKPLWAAQMFKFIASYIEKEYSGEALFTCATLDGRGNKMLSLAKYKQRCTVTPLTYASLKMY